LRCAASDDRHCAGPNVGPELLPTDATAADFAASDVQGSRPMPLGPQVALALAVWGSGL